jgi:hypothetical protein
MGKSMSARDYLRRAQECIEMAESMGIKDQPKLLEIADAWLRLARIAAADESSDEPKSKAN